jgi:tripartite-type tricarboxylate transporter receptor subunit TctC
MTFVSPTRRRPWLCGTALALFAASAMAQDYPNKPIKLLTPFSAGGMVDTVTRSVAQHLSERLGQSVVVENRLGASGAIALEQVARAPADGYTLLMASSTNFVFLPASRKTLPYDTVKDLRSVTMISTAPMYFVVHPSVPAQNVAELIALARKSPNKLSYASLGHGSSNHLAMDMFRSRAQVELLHVPYKGSAQAITDLLSGQVQAMFEGPTSTLPNIKTGKLRVLASSGAARTRAMPAVPTVGESGVAGYDFSTWNGIAVPGGTPRAVIDRLNAAAGEMLRSPAAIEKFAAQNIELIASTPEEMDERIRRELPVFAKVMRDAGIQPE